MGLSSDTVKNVVYLVRCALDDVVPDAARVAAMDLDELLEVSREHLLVSACATALETAGVRDERFVQAWCGAVRKVAFMDAEREALFKRMDAAGIWHMPLKGCVLQDLWPAYGMRQMADNDILFDAKRAFEVREILTSMGFLCESFGESEHDVYYKQPLCNFELHRALFSGMCERAVYKYYRDPTRLLVPDGDGTYGMHMSNEDCYVYHVAHEYKHFAGCGTGLRSIADTYVLLRAFTEAMDWEYVNRQLRELGLLDFERSNRALALALFSGRVLTREQEATLAYVVGSGPYGQANNDVRNKVARYGRVGYFVRTAFPPFREMVDKYSVLKTVPALLPVFWVWRLASSVVTKPEMVIFRLRGMGLNTGPGKGSL